MSETARERVRRITCAETSKLLREARIDHTDRPTSLEADFDAEITDEEVEELAALPDAVLAATMRHVLIDLAPTWIKARRMS